MPTCTKCGRKGLFLRLTEGICKDCIIRNETQQVIVTECPRQETQIELQSEQRRKQALSMAAWQDKELRQLQTQYYRLSEEIEADYTVYINGQGGPDASERLEQKCLQGAMLFHQLVPYMNKYEQSLPNSTVVFKRLAMLREKRGDYEGAALACVQQMRLGVFGDGSKSGMRGRLARMIKKGNLSQNKRIMAEASKYLEVQ